MAPDVAGAEHRLRNSDIRDDSTGDLRLDCTLSSNRLRKPIVKTFPQERVTRVTIPSDIASKNDANRSVRLRTVTKGRAMKRKNWKELARADEQ